LWSKCFFVVFQNLCIFFVDSENFLITQSPMVVRIAVWPRVLMSYHSKVPLKILFPKSLVGLISLADDVEAVFGG